MHEDGSLSDEDPLMAGALPPTVALFRADSLFMLHRAMSLQAVLEMLGDRPRVFVLGLDSLPTVDPRGLRIMRALLDRCRARDTLLVIGGVSLGVRAIMGRTGLLDDLGIENVFPHLPDALIRARVYAQR